MLPALIFALVLLMLRGENGDSDFGRRLVLAFRQTIPFLCVTVLYLLMRLNAFGGKLGPLRSICRGAPSFCRGLRPSGST